MSEAKPFDAAAGKSADYKAAVIEFLQKVDHIQQQIDDDQQEIDRLRTETREILARLEAA